VDFCTQTPDQVDPFGAHPVRHENGYGMSQGAAYGGKSNSRISARRFDDETVRSERPSFITSSKDMKRHPVFDAAGHIEIFGFGIDGSFLSSEGEFDGQEGSISDKAGQLANLTLFIFCEDDHEEPPGK
jgi:hypothetical protein